MLDQRQLEAHIAQQMEKHRIPGLSITFSGEGGVFYEKAFGFADGERRRAVTPDTIMGVASLSKSFTCVCLALLEHAQKLSLDDPVTRFFPRLKIPGTPKDSLLVRHLMTHTSGLPPLPTLSHSMAAHTARDAGENAGTDALDRPIKVDTVEDIIDYINGGDYTPLGQPGEYMSYSNDGYALLSSIIDIAAGVPMEQYLQKMLFEPLGMSRSALGFDKLGDFDDVTQVFTKQKDGEITASDNWNLAPPYRGCGWIISTSRDMHKYYKMLSQGGALDGVRVLPEAVAARMLGGDFPTAKTAVYAYGFNKILLRGETMFTHTGGLKGVSSAGAFFKDRGVAGALLTNIGGADAMRMLMGAFNLITGYEPDAVTHNFTLSTHAPQEPHIFEGYYGGAESGLSPLANPHRVAIENGALTLKLPNEDAPRELSFCGGTQFYAAKPAENPLREGISVKFYVRNGKAWGMQSGSRLLQRI